MRIIIADDRKHTRNGLRAVLVASLPGPQIWEATTGLEVVRLAEEVHPHLILMDIRMPEMDGLAATRSIKTSHPEIRILVLSLHAAASQDAMDAGADAFVSKGESPQRLLDAIATLADPTERP
ncbi:MAG: response regulator transcription factor [Spirochaetia bacterium]|jgi:DNA-binding NarL/FixJ family response regulator